MKIIDFEKKGNVVRFYLGAADCGSYWGDDWGDSPYDSNAGKVDDKYITGICDKAFPFDDLVLEPCDVCYGCDFSKEDMKSRRVPCIIVVPQELAETSWETDFPHWVGADGVTKFYFGDHMDVS